MSGAAKYSPWPPVPDRPIEVGRQPSHHDKRSLRGCAGSNQSSYEISPRRATFFRLLRRTGGVRSGSIGDTDLRDGHEEVASIADAGGHGMRFAAETTGPCPQYPSKPPTTMEKSSPLTSRSQPRWGRYPILPNPITCGNAASTNTPTAYSDSTSQKVQISLLCPIPRSKGSRINSTLVPERYSAIELLARFSSTPKISPLHFAVEWAAAFHHGRRKKTHRRA
jgi:hypothetical protein